MEEYTIKQAAEILEVSNSTIRRRIKSGKIKAKKKEGPYGDQYYIPETEFNQAVAEKQVIEIKEIGKPISAEIIINQVLEGIEEKNRDLIDNAVNTISDKIDSQKKQLETYKQQLKHQNDLIKDMKAELNEIRSEQKESVFYKLRKILFGK